MTTRSAFALVALIALAGPPAPALAQSADSAPNPRIALAIGESNYADQTLATPANDAALIAQTLQAAGYDVVGARDLDQKSLRAAMRGFLAKAAAIGPTMQAFVYLAGRGVQYEGDNFLVPVDAQIGRDSDVPIEAVRIADFAHALAAEPGQARILALDAARADPYPDQGPPLAGGLALVEPDPGLLMAFNAAPGSIVGDEPGPYGVYAKTLAGAMRQGGLPIEDVFAQTRVGVNQSTGGGQIPWSASKLRAPYFVFERAADAPPPPAEAALADAAMRPIGRFSAEAAYAAAVERDSLSGYEEFLAAYSAGLEAKRARAILAARREALFWRRSVEQDSAPAYWTYLNRYPRGPHVTDAERRLAILSAGADPPVDFAPQDYADLPPPPPDELAYANRPVFVFAGADFGPPPPPPPLGFVAEEDRDWRDLPAPAPPTAIGVLPALKAAIPLLAAARPYRDAGRQGGLAAPGAPPPLAQAPAPPPPLPGGLAARSVAANAAPRANAVKPTPTPGAKPSKLLTPTPTPTSAAEPLNLLKPTPKPAATPVPAPSKPPRPAPTSAAEPLNLSPATPIRTPSNLVKPAPVADGLGAPAKPQEKREEKACGEPDTPACPQ
jgi:uncharacterized caspase-like protein